MNNSVKFDAKDCKILEILQQNADTQVSDVAQQVGLSQTPTWRRIQRMKEEGVIMKNVALLSPQKVNVGVTVFVAVRTSMHTQAWFEKFKAVVQAIPEVVEFYRMSGQIDYLLKIVVPDIDAYDAIYKRLISRLPVFDVSSMFAMEEIKASTVLPLSYTRDRSKT